MPENEINENALVYPMKKIFHMFSCGTCASRLCSRDLKFCTHICGNCHKIKDVPFPVPVKIWHIDKHLKGTKHF